LKNGIVVNATFPGLPEDIGARPDAVKLDPLPLKTFWMKILPIVLVSRQEVIVQGSWKLNSPTKRKTEHSKRHFLL
jgi:hypothetical protein